MTAVTSVEQKLIRAQLAKQTFNEVVEKLNSTKKCMLIRPTGFGKTYLLAHLTKKFKHVLYLYPIDIIRLDVATKYKDIINTSTRYMTYKKLISLYKADKDNMKLIANKYDLIICDEAHMVGAEMTSEAMKELTRVAEANYFIGATATPDRSDGFDVAHELFNDTVISEYTLHDAIADGLIPKPHYIYSIYNANGSFREISAELEKFRTQDRYASKATAALDRIKDMEVEMSNVINAPKVIRETINELHGELGYMKFIIFFSEKVTLSIKKGEAERWFKEAYPNMKIRNLIITSEAEYAKNIHELDNMKYEPNTIDLIYCIDMLNMGYHIEDLTGIVMLRGTSSNIIYKQQIGRCLSAASNNTPIIFDLVNNILKKPYFGMYKDNKGADTKDPKSSGHRLNDLTIRDLVMSDKTASYRQFIDKAVNEIAILKIEDAMYRYVYRSCPMKILAKETRLSEDYIRKEFKKRGITMDD